MTFESSANRFRSFHILVLLAGLSLLSTGANAVDASIGAKTDVSISALVPSISGGIGAESQAEMNAVSGQYRLRIVDSLKGGAFVAGVHVKLRSAAGDLVLDTRTEGPILLVNPQPGNYTLISHYEGQTQSRPVTVPEKGQAKVSQTWEAPPDKPKTRVKGNMETTITIP